MRARRQTLILVAVATLAWALPTVSSAVPPPGTPVSTAFEVDVVSTRPDLVTGGDALVRVGVPHVVPPHRVTVTVDGTDVSAAFREVDDGVLLGLVEGLPAGTATLRVEAPGRGRGRPAADLQLTNHPVTGPILYPQAQPFFCEADTAFDLPITDPATCSTDTRTTWLYRTAGGTTAPFDPAGGIPADAASTTTTTGATVPFTVRLEEGTINRAVYQVAVLDDPTVPGPDPWTPEPGWNRRLVHTFGGGCNHGWHQGTATGGVLDAVMLGRGYAVASATLNVLDINCNDVVSAETALMVQEHVVESLGVVDHTIGWGGSGGAIQQYLLAENYPGILDGILPAVGFPDATTVLPGVSDCRLLVDYFEDPGVPWSTAAQTAVSGFATWNTCLSWDASFANRIDPDEGCNPAIPPDRRYDADTNPDGLRCTVHDYMADIFGTDPDTGFAFRALDNVGVQYGLQALLAGAITPEQFVDLNEQVGGYDADATIVEARTVAEPSAVEAAYATGRITSGARGLAATPIIDFRLYLDPLGDIHDRFRSFAMRQRLVEANGHADNQVIWVAGTPADWAAAGYQALAAMDEWLTTGAKPADLVDGCWLPDGTRVDEPAGVDGDGACAQTYPTHGDPRLASGGPLSSDVIKCRLQPLDPGAYPGIEFTEDLWERLEAAFPDGVCDWTRPGIGQVPIARTWRTYLP